MYRRQTFDKRRIAESVGNVPATDMQKGLPDRLLELFADIHDEGIPVLPIFDEAPKKEQARLTKTIGARMKEARELTNMSQQAAAERLGYANSSKLAKIEKAADTNSVPLYLIHRAAKLYDVSTDFLFGLSEDWEPGIRRETNTFLVMACEEARRRDLEAIQHLYRRIQAIAGFIEKLVAGSNEVAAALRAVRERSDSFDTMPAGNRLLSTIERHVETARHAEGDLRRFRAELLGKALPTD